MTLKLLDHWPEFDRNDNLTGRRIIGIKAKPIAVILKGPHHVEFLHLAKYAPELLHALELARDHLEVSNYEGEEDETLALINAVLTKAKGE